MIRKQKYLESLERNDIAGALHVLQKELSPLRIEMEELHALSRYYQVNKFDSVFLFTRYQINHIVGWCEWQI